MKTLKLSAVFLFAAVIGTAAVAQDKAAPAAAPAAPATVVKAPVAAPTAAIAINGYVYVEKLPTPTQLMSEAEAEHLAITRMDQTADRVVVVYQYPSGQTRAFAYTTTAPTGEAPAPVVTAQSTSAATYTVVSAPPPPAPGTVVYAEPETRVVYYESPRYVSYYDPAWDFWAPLAVGVGLGWTFGGHGYYHGGGYHGGFHGGGGFSGHGGHR